MAEKDKGKGVSDASTIAESSNDSPSLIKVRATVQKDSQGGFPVVLWDRDPAHATYEVFIADPDEHEVVLTAKVADAIRRGVLEKV
jgi:hypothetical protein